MRRLAAGCFAALAALACATSLDLREARKALAAARPEPAPVLRDEPNPDLAAVEGLRAISGELRAIPLRWEPSHDRATAGYVVDRAPSPDGPFAYIATVADRYRTVCVDRGLDLAPKREAGRAGGSLGHAETYSYRVRPFDRSGRISSATPLIVSATTAAKPAPPTGVQAYSHLPRRVALRWVPAADPNVGGYIVYRSPSASGEFATLGRVEGRHQTVFLDNELPDLGVFYYRVASVDSSGAIGDPSDAEQAVTKPEPLPPTDLRISAQSVGANELIWAPNVETDLVGYRLVRQRAGEKEFQRVGAPGRDATRARDAGVGAGERVTYVLFAIDADGLRSAASDPLVVASLDYGLRAEPAPGGVRLRWDAAAQNGFEETKVLLASGLGDPKEIGRAASAEFLHRDAKPGAKLRYQLVGVRPDGSEAPPSRLVEVRVPE